ncbi:MAG: DNA translocase FtsK [Eubacterium sp.]|nr:DNA translocase FtsK [Eubacterium sp.]
MAQTKGRKSPGKKSPAGRTSGKRTSNSRNDKELSPIYGEVVFVILLILSVFILLSLFGLCGVVGNALAHILFGLFGAVSYIFPFILVFTGFVLLNSDNERVKNKSWYGLGMFLSICGIVQWFFNDEVKNVWGTFDLGARHHYGGGFFGGLLSFELSKLLGRVGDLILLLGLLLLFFILFSRKLIFSTMNTKVKDRKNEYDMISREKKAARAAARQEKRRQMQIYTFEPDKRMEEEAHIASMEKKEKELDEDVHGTKADEIKTGQAKDTAFSGDPADRSDNLSIAKNKNRRNKKPSDTAVMEAVDPKVEQSEKEKALQDIHIKGINTKKAEDTGISERELEAKFGRHEPVEETTGSAARDENTKISLTIPEDDPSDVPEHVDPDNDDIASAPHETTNRETNTSEASGSADNASDDSDDEPKKKPVITRIPYKFPPLDLLSKPKAGSGKISETELKETALKLKDTLDSFGVGVSLGDISVGPSVTRYELVPDQGVKVSRITALADDIKLALAAEDIRIEAPIPGKSAVGIEVPNATRVMITLRELLESDEFQNSKSRLSFAVGKDISGKTIVTDIAKMPHVLVAGSTGSGKSVLINTLIMSIIFKSDPNDVKLIMVDPKMVEFMAFADIPHLMIPVVDDPKKASAALAWAVAEMEKRYKKFAELGIRDISSYNNKIEKMKIKDDPEYQKMPQIVIIVDEFADLMMVASHDVEDSVMRIAQKARAAGIHLVLATQRPSVNVITGVIKANIPSRIALSVSSQVDSRTIIDTVGAEKLLGNGDMLFAPQSLPKPIRVQGAFVSDDDRDKVVAFLKETSGSAYDESVTESIENVQTVSENGGGDAEAPVFNNDRDALFAEAGRFIIEKNKASIGALQRAFRIGFNRAARIMDQLSDAGVVGPEEGTKAREIIMDPEQFNAFLEEDEN